MAEVFPRTLVLVAGVPGGKTVGQILLREMFAQLEPSRLVFAGLVDAGEEGKGAGDLGAFRAFRRPRECSRSESGGLVDNLMTTVSRMRSYDPQVRRVAEDVAAYARDNGVERIWAIFNMPSVVDVCHHLLERLRLPLIAHVWDDIEHLTTQRNMDRLTRKRVGERFGRLLARSQRCAVIGEQMAAHYGKVYGAACEIVRHGVSDGVSTATGQTSRDEFLIGFSGGMYCPSAWKALQKALERLHWRVGERPVRLVVMSGKIGFDTRAPANVTFLGWRSDAEVHVELGKCDLLYLPQPFEASQRPLAELSFPTKLSAYVSTGKPVLVHGPGYASVIPFAHAHGFGPVCESLDPALLAAEIERTATDPARHASYCRGSAHVAASVLSRSEFRRQVQTFVCGRTSHA